MLKDNPIRFLLELFLPFVLFTLLPISSGIWHEYPPKPELIEKVNKEIEEQCKSNLKCPSTINPPPLDPTLEKPWISVPVKSLHGQFFRSLFNLILDEALFFNEWRGNGRKTPPYLFNTPEEIRNNINLTLGREGHDHEELIKLFSEIIKYSPHVSHPYYFHKDIAGLDPYALAGDFMSAPMNSLMVMYLCAPVYSLVEIEVLKKLRILAGYDETGKGDGIVTPFPLAFALQIALQKKFPDFKNSGYPSTGGKVAIFISEDQDDTDAIKAAIFEGAGSESIYKVKADDVGRMRIDDLKRSIDLARTNGREPLLLIGNAGTSTTSSIDPLEELASIARAQGIFFHIDSSCGGALLLSSNKKGLLRGLEKSGSFSWNPSCLLGVPYNLDMIFTKEENLLNKTFAIGSRYVFQNVTGLSSSGFDLGDATIQTSRRPEIFKLWFMMKAKGRKGLEDHLDYIFKHGDILKEEIKKRKGRFTLISENIQIPIISFYYIPPELRSLNRKSGEFVGKMSKFTHNLKKDLTKKGLIHLVVSKSNKKTHPDHFTLNLGNSALYSRDLIYLLDQIENIGSGSDKKIYPPPPPSQPSIFASAPLDNSNFKHRSFFRKLFDMILDRGLYFQEHRKDPALLFRKPDDLANQFDLSLDLKGSHETQYNESALLSIMDNVIKFSSHQSHPYWVYQLISGLDPYTVAGDLILGAISTPTKTFEDNPVLSLVEKEVYSEILKRIGSDWPVSGVGITTPGGSMAMIQSIVLAIHRKYPEGKEKGLSGRRKKLVLFISSDSHYAYSKGSYFTGIGMSLENRKLIKTDSSGRMNATELRLEILRTIENGGEPFFVGATAGTTILGAFDPIEEIAEICKEFGLWLGVDGAFGGSLILSDMPNRRAKLNGVELADSFSFNPAKLFGSTITMTCFLVKDGNLAKLALQNDSGTFEKSGIFPDPGDFQLQSSRGSMLKLWTMWKAKGTEHLGNHIEYIYSNAEFCVEQMTNREGFVLFLKEFELTNIIFMYVPKKYRHLDMNSQEFKNTMEWVGFHIQARLVTEGIMVIVAQHEQNSPLQLKFVLMSSGVSKKDIIYLIDQVENFGESL